MALRMGRHKQQPLHTIEQPEQRMGEGERPKIGIHGLRLFKNGLSAMHFAICARSRL